MVQRAVQRAVAFPPRILIMPGCSGSSFIARTARALFALNDVTPYEHGDETEWLSPGKNPFYTSAGKGDQTSMSSAITKLHHEAVRNGQTLLVKWNNILHLGPGTIHDAKLVATLRKMGGLLIVLARGNVLDQIICSVRDCFPGPGHLVHANGTQSLECDAFRASPSHFGTFRRKQRASDYKVYLEPKRLARDLVSRLNFARGVRARLEQANLSLTTYDTLLYEELALFQWGTSAELQRSCLGWAALLRAWAVPSSPETCEYLRKNAGRRPPPQAHWELIHNYAEVKHVLKQNGVLQGLLRDWRVPNIKLN